MHTITTCVTIEPTLSHSSDHTDINSTSHDPLLSKKKKSKLEHQLDTGVFNQKFFYFYFILTGFYIVEQIKGMVKYDPRGAPVAPTI